MSDVDSTVIDAFGIRNTNIPEDHDWYGVPYPGMYLVDEWGVVFDKHFVSDHTVRESAHSALQERFAVHIDRQGLATVRTEGVTAQAWFTMPTIRAAQLTVLTVELELAPGLHVYGRPLPEGYIPVELQVDGGDDLEVEQVVYPPAQPRYFAVIGETLPAYSGRVPIKARCLGRARQGRVKVHLTLRYQACDETRCYLPERIAFELPLEVLAHDFERI